MNVRMAAASTIIGKGGLDHYWDGWRPVDSTAAALPDPRLA